MKTAIITALLAFVLVAASANALTVDRILLSSDNHADATVAGAIAEDINAALVITPRTVFTKAILDNITAASPRKVIIIGGASAVPQAYIDALKAANIEVKVVGGKTRQQTSIMAYNEFKSELNKRPLIADGKEEIAVQDAIPVYLYDNKDEIKAFAAQNANAEATSQARVKDAGVGGEVKELTAKMVEDVRAEISAFKASQDKEGIILATDISAIMSVHGGKVNALAKVEQTTGAQSTGGVYKPGAGGLSTNANVSTKVTADVTVGQTVPI